MNQIEKEITKTTTTRVVRFVAYDGTEWADEKECETYEKSAECAYRALLGNCFKEIPLKNPDSTMPLLLKALDWFLDDCREESTYYMLTLSSNEDKKNFIAWTKCIQYFGMSGSNDFWTNEGKIYSPYTSLEELEIGKTYLIIRTYDSNYFRIYNKDKIVLAVKTMFENFENYEVLYPWRTPNTSDNESKEN